MATTNTSRRRQQVKPARKVHLYDGAPALLEMTVGKDTFSYWLSPIAADYGLAFEVKKLLTDGGDVYHVHIDPARPSLSTCTCKGGTYHGHCKHAESILALIRSGKIAVPAPAPERRSTCETSLTIPDSHGIRRAFAPLALRRTEP